jgi:hypothetical protein
VASVISTTSRDGGACATPGAASAATITATIGTITNR